MTHQIELRRVDGEKGFNRGERAIYVDGVRWGRTHVNHHGMHGTSHTFQQLGGDFISDTSESGREHQVTVRSMRKRFSNRDTWKPTEEIVLQKATELVAAGRLCHPDVVKAEADEEHQQWLKKREQQKLKEERALSAKAVFVLQQLKGYSIPPGAYNKDIALIVEAMKWAQTQ